MKNGSIAYKKFAVGNINCNFSFYMFPVIFKCMFSCLRFGKEFIVYKRAIKSQLAQCVVKGNWNSTV